MDNTSDAASDRLSATSLSSVGLIKRCRAAARSIHHRHQFHFHFHAQPRAPLLMMFFAFRDRINPRIAGGSTTPSLRLGRVWRPRRQTEVFLGSTLIFQDSRVTSQRISPGESYRSARNGVGRAEPVPSKAMICVGLIDASQCELFSPGLSICNASVGCRNLLASSKSLWERLEMHRSAPHFSIFKCICSLLPKGR